MLQVCSRAKAQLPHPVGSIVGQGGAVDKAQQLLHGALAREQLFWLHILQHEQAKSPAGLVAARDDPQSNFPYQNAAESP